MNDKQLIIKMIELGLSEHKALRLLDSAKSHEWSLQKAYFNMYRSLFLADLFLIIYISGFISYTAFYENKDAIVALLIFGLILIVAECCARLHKDYLKTIKILVGLRALSIPEKLNRAS